MKSKKLSPLPWSWRSETDPEYPGASYDTDHIVAADGTSVMHLYANQKCQKNPNYAFIVKTCNAHEELVRACRLMREIMQLAYPLMPTDIDDHVYGLWKVAEKAGASALAKAEVR